MRKFLDFLRSLVSGIRHCALWTAGFTWGVAKWTVDRLDEGVTSLIQLPGAILAKALEPVIEAASKDSAAQQAARQAALQPVQESEKAQAKMTCEQVVRAVQRAAKWKSDGDDISDLIDTMPYPVYTFIRCISTEEAYSLASADPALVLAWLDGKAERVPGVPTGAELSERLERGKTPGREAGKQTGCQKAPEPEAATPGLRKLREALLASGRKSRGSVADMDHDADYDYAL